MEEVLFNLCFSSDCMCRHVSCEVVSLFEVLTTHLTLKPVSVSFPFETAIFFLTMMTPHMEYWNSKIVLKLQGVSKKVSDCKWRHGAPMSLLKPFHALWFTCMWYSGMSKYQTCLGILYKCTKEHEKVQEHSQEPYVSICNHTLFIRHPALWLRASSGNPSKDLMDPRSMN